MSSNTESARQMPVVSAGQPGEVTKPPHPLDGRWYMNVDDQTFGPFTGHELSTFADEGRIERDTQVSRVGSGTWTEAGADSALRRFFPLPERPPLVASRGAAPGVAQSGDNGTVVQVTNNIRPSLPPDLGADKSPGLALFLSLVFVGLGQIYNGDVGKGILMLFGCLLLWVAFLGWIINIWSMVDAYGRAKELRTRHQAYLASLRAA